MLYSTSPADTSVSVVEAFKKKYGLQAEFYRQTSVKMMERVQAELKSNQVLADVLGIDIPLSTELARDGVFAAFEPAERKAIDARWKTPHYTTVRVYVEAIIWNTNLVKPADEPKGWQDLAGPKYRGKLAIADVAGTITSIQWTYLMKRLYGVEYLQKFGQNKPRMADAPSALGPLVAAGEVPIAVTLEYLVPQQKAKGAPVSGIIPAPTFYGTIDMGVMAKAPHPNAARLFYNFIVSKEGQEAFCGPVKSIATHPDANVPDAYKLKDVKELVDIDYAEFEKQVPQLRDEFNKYLKG